MVSVWAPLLEARIIKSQLRNIWHIESTLCLSESTLGVRAIRSILRCRNIGKNVKIAARKDAIDRFNHTHTHSMGKSEVVKDW